jgi:MoxR-like ATPase
MVLLGREIETNTEYRNILENFVESPVADTFVNLHEDFYQNHKMDDYEIAYTDIADVDTSGWHSYSSSYAVIRENKADALKKEEAVIARFPEDAFGEEQKALIPRLSSEFVLPEDLTSVCNAVAEGDCLSVLFHGPAGTGKTMSCKLVCQATGLPVLETINCTENLDEFVLGKYIPQDDKIVFKESYVTKAIRDGGAVVFEEINFAKPQYLAFLNSLLDDNGFVRLDNGEVVKRNANFRFFATMNMGYFGTKDLNQALYNRFHAIVEIAALSDEAIARMLVARVPECKPLVDKILGVYHKVKKKIEAEELDVVISPRNLENWARLAKYDGYVKAAEKTIIPIAKCDRALEDTIRGIMMLYKWKV